MSYYEKYLKYKTKYITLKNNMIGGEFNKSIVEGYNLAENYKYKTTNIQESKCAFIALFKDNPGLNDDKNKFYYDEIVDEDNITTYKLKNELDVKVKVNDTLVNITGRAYHKFSNGFLIIKKDKEC